MFEPELFGLGSAQYQQAVVSLVTPVLGFLFLYALGLPLKRIPFIDAIEGYSPPTWLLPLFALGSTFILSLCLSISTLLNLLHAYPDEGEFAQGFAKERRFEQLDNLGSLQSAGIELRDFDGLSNFEILVNGYRVLGSASDCLLSYQCRPGDSVAAAREFEAVQDLHLRDKSFHHIHSLNSLPHSVDILPYVASGDNFIDVISGNSGVGDCRLVVAISLAFLEATPSYKVIISPEQGDDTVQQQAAETISTFFAGGPLVKANEEPPKFIKPYGTLWTEGTNRLCERIRIRFKLAQELISRQMRERILFARHRAALCEVLNNERPYCQREPGK
ncbi:hypothetical protein [Bradyrhizobium viridifuturi]|uniref:hypothetical protein n=1 Tax=Bradyrhizobium viridifuturi TaxID=1654716 RepID=UPI00067E6DD8|nr:hypothetical protein [Bradyrhizobium viridifuturi]